MLIEDAKILITDDSILARKQLKDMISTVGTPVFYEARDGQDAINQYKRNKPDLVFFFFFLPNKDGNSVILEIMDFDADAPIIIVSSAGKQSQLKKAIEAGAREFIQKPLNQQQVIDTVNRFLEGR